MSLVYRYLLPIFWLTWATYWWVSARNVKATTRREPLWARFFDGSLLALAGLLFWVHPPFPILWKRFLPLSAATFWIGAALTAGGLLFAVWARRHLGRNWSGTVTLKEDHELITSSSRAVLTPGFGTRSIPAFCSPFQVPRWRREKGVESFPLPSPSGRSGAACGSRSVGCASSSARRMWRTASG
jgi:hypothetical protein